MNRFVTAFFIAFVGLTLVSSVLLPGTLWGLGAWGALGSLVAFAASLVAVLALRYGVRPENLDILSRVRPRPLALALFTAAALALFWILRMRPDLWGERLATAAVIEREVKATANAPLGTFIQWAVYRFMNGSFLWSGRETIEATSMLVGIGYVFGALRAASLLAGEAGGARLRIIAAAVILTSGFVSLYFGAGGSTPIAALFALLFIVSAIGATRGRRSIIPATILLALAILCQLSAAHLAPAWIWLVIGNLRSRERRGDAIAAGAIGIVGALALGALLSRAAGLDALLARLASGASFTPTLPPGIPPPGAGEVALSTLNGLLIAGPAALLMIVLAASGGFRAAKERALLATLSVPALLVYPLSALRVEEGLRWDLLAATGPAISIAALALLIPRIPYRAALERSALLLAVLGIFHTTALVFVAAVPPAAERRLLSLPLLPGRGEMILAHRALEANDLATARARLVKVIEKNPRNDDAFYMLGGIAMREEQYAEAISHYTAALDIYPSSTICRMALVEALLAKNWYREAIQYVEPLVEQYPDSVRFWRKYGFALNNGGRHEEAIRAYEKALSLEPANEENLRNLVSAVVNRGAALQKEGKPDEAKEYYHRAITIYPADWHAWNNLAVIEMDRKDYKEALRILRESIAEFPYEGSLHFNLAIVLEKLGKDAEALAHMREAQTLDPMDRKPAPHIERLEQKVKGGR